MKKRKNEKLHYVINDKIPNDVLSKWKRMCQEEKKKKMEFPGIIINFHYVQILPFI